jgi:hypothetical protein
MFDPTLPLENTEIDAAQMRAQLNGLKALIDPLASQLAALAGQVADLTAAVVTNFPTALEIAALSFDVGPLTMQVTYAENGGDHAVEQTLVWWTGTGSPNRTPLVRPVQEVSMSGLAGMLVYFQTEVKNAAGVAVVSGVRSYFVD